MRTPLLDILRCPETGQRLRLEAQQRDGEEIVSGWLVSEDGKHRYPVDRGIPRFVPASNYADNFGKQWNMFRKTQLDSYSGHDISTARFWKSTGWKSEAMRGKWVLDAGCGAGRFAEVALTSGAQVVALDYSSAVEACLSNLGNDPNIHVVQGDIYRLPFERRSFEFVYSLGVLQHTPDVARAFAALPPMIKEGGALCVDYYRFTWKSVFLPKYWLRPITRRVPDEKLFSFLEKAVPKLLPISRTLGSVPGIGRALRRIVPVVDYYGVLPLDDNQHLEWSLLDTFDMFAPAYDQPQTERTARHWMEEQGVSSIEVFNAGHLVARGRVK